MKYIKIKFTRELPYDTLRKMRILGSKYLKDIAELDKLFKDVHVLAIHSKDVADPYEHTDPTVHSDFILTVSHDANCTEIIEKLKTSKYIESAENTEIYLANIRLCTK